MFCVFAVNFLSALWIICRIWHDSETYIERNVGIMTIGISVFLAHEWPMVSLFTAHSTSLLWLLLKLWRKSLALHQLKSDLRAFLDHLILGMRSGRSFRACLNDAANELENGLLARQLKPWIAAVHITAAPPTYPQWWRDIALELTLIDKQSHQAMARLQKWREIIKLEADFRRRSGQIMVQIRLQTFLVSGLYLALLIFSSVRGTWIQHPTLAGLSMILFLAGIALIFGLGKKVKWTF